MPNLYSGLAKHTVARLVWATPEESRPHGIAADPRVIEKTGSLLEAGVLARDDGFTDVNGTQRPPFRLPANAGGSNRPRER